jgi:hypothetical protein
MPNFTALRSTTEFELTTQAQMDAQYSMTRSNRPRQTKRITYHVLGPAKVDGLPDAELFWIGSLAQVVTSRGGIEVVDTPSGDVGQSDQTSFNLTSTGEFGQMLAVVLVDAYRSKITWDRWEQGSSGPLAIFRYAVPKENSRFAVGFTKDNQAPEYPAYKGEIAIEPASGSILRITIVANGSGPGFVNETSIMVEFGPIQIAGTNYICPVRGVAIARFFDPLKYQKKDPPPTPIHTSINDVSFTDFHVFRSESRILP